MRRRRLEEEVEDDVELDSSHKEEKGTSQKANPLRSKHSETEQRRRLKINERFQALMDLIPQNDQKRDKASFLLEVIQYIQFLQAKLDMYEGWSQEPSKLAPRRNSVVPIESFSDPQLTRNGSGQEDTYVLTPSMFINSHNSVDSELGDDVAYELLNHNTVPANQAIPVPIQPCQDPTPESQFWQTRPRTTESDLPSYALHEEVRRVDSGEACISNAYSQGLLNKLTQALRSSGVDLTRASISVQLDVVKQGDDVLPSTMFTMKVYFRNSLLFCALL